MNAKLIPIAVAVVCLLLGAALWYLIHQNLVTAPRIRGERTETVIITTTRKVPPQ